MSGAAKVILNNGLQAELDMWHAHVDAGRATEEDFLDAIAIDAPALKGYKKINRRIEKRQGKVERD